MVTEKCVNELVSYKYKFIGFKFSKLFREEFILMILILG